MNLLRLINPSVAHMYYRNYCRNLVSNHSIIRLIRVVSQFQANYAIRFLFCLDLKLHACKIPFRCDSFGILNFATKHGVMLGSVDSIIVESILGKYAGSARALRQEGACYCFGEHSRRTRGLCWVPLVDGKRPT
jgi:hypothetical protein